MKVPATVVGYFEGCHTRYRTIFPDVALRWAEYRKLLDRVEGLKVVDLKSTGAECCSKHPERTFAAAEGQNLSMIVSPCNSCYRRLELAAAGKFQVKHLPQLLLQAVQTQ